MKTDIHPTYNEDAKITCTCGASYTVASDKDREVEICASCHPFFTGEDKMVDTAGRIDKFKARQEKAKAKKAA